MHKIAAQIISSFQKLMIYFKLSLAVSKHKAVILTLSFNLNNDDNSNDDKEEDSMLILQLKKCKVQSINLSFISIRNKVNNQSYNL